MRKKKYGLSRSRFDVLDRLSRGYEMERLGMTVADISKALGYSNSSGWARSKKWHESKLKQEKEQEKQQIEMPMKMDCTTVQEDALVEKICEAFNISRDDLDSLIDLYLSVKTGV